MPIEKKQPVTKVAKQQQKLTKLIDEFTGLKELEDLGVRVGSKAEELIQDLEDAGILKITKECGHREKPSPTKKQKNNDNYEWNGIGYARPTRWFEEAENNGLPDGKGECAKRLKQLAKKDPRQLKRATEKREEVREQLGKYLWKHGIAGLSAVEKPRGVKKQNPASSERGLGGLSLRAYTDQEDVIVNIQPELISSVIIQICPTSVIKMDFLRRLA